MKLNFKIRLKNKAFWVTVIPALFMFLQTLMSALGTSIDLTEAENITTSLIDVVFMGLTVLGVIVDPTTKNISDSERALNYTELG